MPANGERLSAVARQRRLREARSAASTPPVPSPTPTPVVQNVLPEPASQPDADEDNDKDDSDPIATSNQFSTLVEASAVNFSSSREVENVDDTTIKVRLSRGQKCVVLGTYRLWVKHGSISIYGAIIHASIATYRVYAPATYALPPIEALTSKAEVQFESLEDGIRELPYVGVRDQWEPRGVVKSRLSFHLLGVSFEQDLKAPQRLKELNINGWETVLSQFAGPKGAKPSAPSSPRILVCGRRSSGLSTFVRCLLNRLLTTQGPDKGVTLLDFDTTMPQFAPPGTISLVHVVGPVFGPSFTNVTLSQSTARRIMKTHFLGDFDGTELSDWHIDRVNGLLALEQNHRVEKKNVPVILLAPKWLNDVDQHIAMGLWKRMLPTDIICMDTRPSSPHLQAWKPSAEAVECRIHQIPAQVFDKMSPAREHDLQMQSYFHMSECLSGSPYWTHTPILTRSPVILSYAENRPDICGVVLLGGNVALEDTFDALEGSTVAITLVQEQQHEQLNPIDPEAEVMDVDDFQRYGKDKWHVARTEELIPRMLPGSSPDAFPYSADGSHCIGFGMVAGVGVVERQLSLITPVEPQKLRARRDGCRIALVIHKATPDGRFKTDWARKEVRSSGSG
ncbi:Polynucleotide 5'-hydroxyl-kinase grc3 [Exophiala xenobiotica]|nr:Polynucleotide 5'-hydroxyl-kinase grc3 [Exophiala xenobiotica]